MGGPNQMLSKLVKYGAHFTYMKISPYNRKWGYRLVLLVDRISTHLIYCSLVRDFSAIPK